MEWYSIIFIWGVIFAGIGWNIQQSHDSIYGKVPLPPLAKFWYGVYSVTGLCFIGVACIGQFASWL